MKIIFLRRRNIFLILGGIMVLLILILLFINLLKDSTAPTMQVDPIYQGNKDKPCVALTINVDWGEDIIPNMLDILDAKGVKATFFITGRFAAKFPEIVKIINDKNHDIGNHGYSHPHPDKISVEKNLEELKKTHDILKEITQKDISLFAPPYGERGSNCLQAAQQAGYKTILWTADTIDWQEPPPSVNTLVNRVTGKKLTNGTIVLMHPKPHTLEALPVIIDVIINKGYQIQKVSEII